MGRQLPGSTNATDTKLWVTFAASFIQGAILYAGYLDAQKAHTLESFEGFLLNGAIQSGIVDHDALA